MRFLHECFGRNSFLITRAVFRHCRKPPGAMTTPGRYQLTATRGGVEVLRQGFDDRGEPYAALGEALVRFPDCEIRLTLGDTVLISARTWPARTT